MELLRDTLPSNNSNIRFLHSVGNAPNVDVYINGALVAENLAFSKLSKYSPLPQGDLEIQIYNTGVYDSPLLTQNLNISSNSNYTVSIVTLENQLYLFSLMDNKIPQTNNSAFLRFINLSPNSPLLTLNLDNDNVLFYDVEYLETNNYYPLSAGKYTFKLIISSDDSMTKNIRNITLDENKFYTIYIIGIVNGEPILGYLFVDDLATKK